MAEVQKFDIGIAEMLTTGWSRYRAHFVPVTLAGAATFAVYGLFRWWSDVIEGPWESFGVELAGLIVSGAAALPWYRGALAAADDTEAPGWSSEPERFRDLAVASVFFWAGVLLGLRYLRGIPAIFVVIFYAFHGFAVADGKRRKALRALGHSVLLGQGKRLGVAAVGGLLLLINLLAFLPLGFSINPATMALTVAALLITTSWSMVCGALVYRALGRATTVTS